MNDWLHIPERRRSLPTWRLCALMGITFLILWISAPVLFGLDWGTLLSLR